MNFLFSSFFYSVFIFKKFSVYFINLMLFYFSLPTLPNIIFQVYVFILLIIQILSYKVFNKINFKARVYQIVVKSFEIQSLTFQSTDIWNAISTIYQVTCLQKSRHLSPQTTLPQSFIGQYTLTVEAFVNFAICPVVHATKFSLSQLSMKHNY